MAKQIPNELKVKIKTYIKNKIDIGPLIKDYSIKDMDLSYAIIGEFSRMNDDMSNCNLSHAQLGSDDKVVSIMNTKLVNCNFESTIFGKGWMRKCDVRNCNFKNADVHKMDYQHTNFKGSTFCNSIITIGTHTGIGCRFPKEMFRELCKGWRMKITAEDIE